MYVPPSDGREHLSVTDPTVESIAVSYLLMAAIPLSMWAVSHPLDGAVLLAIGAVAAVGTRRAAELAQCLSECGGFALDVGETLRITVTRRRADDAC
jgi:hypothetical protein